MTMTGCAVKFYRQEMQVKVGTSGLARGSKRYCLLDDFASFGMIGDVVGENVRVGEYPDRVQ